MNDSNRIDAQWDTLDIALIPEGRGVRGICSGCGDKVTSLFGDASNKKFKYPINDGVISIEFDDYSLWQNFIRCTGDGESGEEPRAELLKIFRIEPEYEGRWDPSGKYLYR